MTTNDRKLLIPVAAVLVSLAIGFLGFWPQLKAYKQNHLLAEAHRVDLEAAKQRQTDLQAYSVKLKALGPTLDKLLVAVPNNPQYPELLVQLKTLAERAGITLVSIQPGRDTLTSGGTNVAVTAQGSFEQLLDFANKIEKNLRPIKVRSMNLSAGQEQAFISATLQLVFEGGANVTSGVVQ